MTTKQKKGIVVILGILAILGAIFLYMRDTRNGLFQHITPQDAFIFFYPHTILVPMTGLAETYSIDVDIQSKTYPLSGAQIEASFDPRVIKNVTLTPSLNTPRDFFPVKTQPIVLSNIVDNTRGRISYAVGISPKSPSVLGNGRLATLTFTIIGTVSRSFFTNIFFTQGTLVTSKLGKTSVLKSVLPLTIQAAFPPPPPPLNVISPKPTPK